MSQSDRVYDLVLHGATGYTGKYARDYISQALPTNLAWAVAGRSEAKLTAVVKELRQLYPDRKQPAIEVVQLKRDELHVLTKKTKIVLNTVGPYALYGEPVVEACARNGTHCFDVTGESPYTKDMIDKYDDVAKASNAIIIPQIGVESAPSDILTYAMVKFLYQQTSQATRESIVTLHSMKGAPSGGTLATIFNIFETYTLKQILAAGKPGSMSALPIATMPSGGLLSTLLGVRAVPALGTLVNSIQAAADGPLVHRSWSLYRTSAVQFQEQADAYGATFNFSCYMNARNIFTGALMTLALALSSVFLLIPPVRWLLAKLVTQAGSGATEEESQYDFLEYRGLAISANDQDHQRAFGKLRFDGSAYHVTAIFMVEAAATLLYDGDDVPARKMQGGLLTPATLGDAYVDRLRRAGLIVETRMLR